MGVLTWRSLGPVAEIHPYWGVLDRDRGFSPCDDVEPERIPIGWKLTTNPHGRIGRGVSAGNRTAFRCRVGPVVWTTTKDGIDGAVDNSDHSVVGTGIKRNMKPARDELTGRSGRTLWIALIAASSIGLSAFFACVTPFVALATLAALYLRVDERWAVVGFVWLANQIVGFGILGYPLTWDCAAWGLAIGLSCGLAVLAASALSTTKPAPLVVSLPFVAAFAAFEAGLFAAGRVLPASGDVFGLPVIRHVFWVNAAALCALMALYQLLSLAGGLSAAKAPQTFAGSLR